MLVCGPGLYRQRQMGHARATEDVSIALDFFGGAEGLLVIVRELYGRVSVYVVHFADEAERVESVVALWIAVAEIVGEERAPASAEADTALGLPFGSIKKIAGRAEVIGSEPVLDFP